MQHSKLKTNKVWQKQGCKHLHPPAPQQPAQQLVLLNWSHFKPEFLGKPEEDTEAHLFRTNNWINTHHFLKDSKFKDFV